MNFVQLKRRVERRERLVEGRALQTQDNWSSLKTTWRESWTPGRIVIAGLLGGFIVGRSAPTRALHKLGTLGGTRWLQLIGPLASMLASLRASFAATAADQAASDVAEKVADDAPDDLRDDDDNAYVGDPANMPRDARYSHDAIEDDIGISRQRDARYGSDRRRPDPSWAVQPPAAEAATDVSER